MCVCPSSDLTQWIEGNSVIPADEGETGVRRFMREVVTQWRSLSMEVRSVRSMLEEVLSNWDKYSSIVASLQAWLEDAEEALNQQENIKRVGCRYPASKEKPQATHTVFHFLASIPL